MPKSGEAIGNSDFHLAYAALLGVPPQCLKAYVGKLKCGKGDGARPLDPYGDGLTCTSASGDGWRKKHDHVKWSLDGWLSHAHIEHTTEVYGLFAATINQEAAQNIDTRTRQGLVPDLGITPHDGGPMELWELKCINQSKTYFSNVGGSRCAGVAHRAASVHQEYVRKAKNVDRDYNNVDVSGGNLGPTGQRLAEYGQVRAIVFGPRGEGSSDAHSLVDLIANKAANRRWRPMGAKSFVVARDAYKSWAYRSIGITAIRANAELIRTRLGILLGDGAAAASRRHASKDENRRAAEEYEAYFARGPGGHGGGRMRV